MGDGVFSIWHIGIVVLVGVVLFYRGDKLPDMARSVGRSLRVFKTEIKGLAEDDKARDAHTAGDGEPGASAPHTQVTKAIEAPSGQAAPRVVPQAAAPLPVHAEVVRTPEQGSRPRPRPAGSAPRP